MYKKKRVEMKNEKLLFKVSYEKHKNWFKMKNEKLVHLAPKIFSKFEKLTKKKQGSKWETLIFRPKMKKMRNNPKSCLQKLFSKYFLGRVETKFFNNKSQTIRRW